MNAFQRTPTPKSYLFLLTLRSKGTIRNAYSMGENAADAIQRYRSAMLNRKENPNDVEFLGGEFANPHMTVKPPSNGITI